MRNTSWNGLRLFLFNWLTMIRITTLGVTLIVIVMGGVTSSRVTIAQLIGLVGVGITFHCYAYVSNDLVDLKLDSTQPVRVDSPLVQGRFKTVPTLLFALVQFPVSLVFTAWLGGPPVSYALICLAYAGLTVYNLWGKKVPVPIVTDIVQGFGWVALNLFGAVAVGGGWNALLAFTAFYVFGINVFLTGVHGGIRDIANDMSYGVKTTTIMLGARPTAEGGIKISRPLFIYGAAWQFALAGSILCALILNWYHYDLISWFVSLGLSLAVLAVSFVLAVKALRQLDHFPEMCRIGLLHILTMLAALIAPFIMYMGANAFVVVFIAFISPVFTSNWNMAAFKLAPPKAAESGMASSRA